MDRHEKLLAYKQTLVEDFFEPATLDELAQFVILAIRKTGAPITGLSWQIDFTPRVSNTHCCPIGEERNWYQTDDKPKFFPGFVGRVWVRYDSEVKRNISFGSSPFGSTLTYTGTGGFGAYDGPWKAIGSKVYRARLAGNQSIPEPRYFSWDYKIFLQDWPLLEDWIGQEQVMHVLAGTEGPKYRHHFLWEDPDMVEQDKKYLNNEAYA